MSYFSDVVFPSSRIDYGEMKFNIDNKEMMAINNQGIRVNGSANISNKLNIGGTLSVKGSTNLSGGLTVNGNANITGTLNFYDPDGSNFIGLKGPSLSSNYVLTLPTDDGTSNQVLKTNGSGVLSWVAQSGGTSLDLINEVNDTVEVTGRMNISSSVNIVGNLSVKGNVNLAGGLTVKGTTNIGGTLKLSSNGLLFNNSSTSV